MRKKHRIMKSKAVCIHRRAAQKSLDQHRTTGLLQTRLHQLLDWHVSESSLRRELHELDYVWKRFRYRLKPDPQCAKKKTHPQTC